MPLGPTLASESYYAGGRLGYTTWVVKVWTSDVPAHYYIVFTRVLSKTAKLALALKEWLLDHLRQKKISSIG